MGVLRASVLASCPLFKQVQRSLSTMVFTAFSSPLVVTRCVSSKWTGQHIQRTVARSPSRRLASNPPRAVLRPQIVVAGGGFGGLFTALRLSSLPWTRLTKPEITLVDKSERFVFLPMMYELALSQVAQWEVAPRFSDLLSHTGIRFVRGTVENLDLSGGSIEGSLQTGGNLSLPFDKAVLAFGAQPAGFPAVPGASDHAIPFYGLSGALALKDKLKSLRSQKSAGEIINIVVVGGGFSGVELATCLAEELSSSASVLLVESGDTVLGNSASFNRECGQKALADNGVTILHNARVIEVMSDSVVVTKSEEGGDKKETDFPADIVLWTAGSKPNSVLQDFGITLDDVGRIPTDDWLRVKGNEDRLYAIGDLSVPENENEYLATAQVAVQQAEYAAWNVWASLTDRKPLRYRYIQLGEMLVFGKANGAVSTPLGLVLSGPTAWIARRAAYAARMPTEQHRYKVAASWAVNPLLAGVGDLVDAGRRYQADGLS